MSQPIERSHNSNKLFYFCGVCLCDRSIERDIEEQAITPSSIQIRNTYMCTHIQILLYKIFQYVLPSGYTRKVRKNCKTFIQIKSLQGLTKFRC